MFADNMKNWKEKLRKQLFATYFHPTCDFCGNELFLCESEAEITLFEPKEVEFESQRFERDENGKLLPKTVIHKETVSSDPSKDTFTFKCPYCGHIFTLTREELKDLKCSFYGDNNMRFTLDEVESKAAHDFMKEHSHKDEFRKQNKLGFSTLGQQFTFEITPGGLGPLVSIKCNHCGKSKDITNIENW